MKDFVDQLLSKRQRRRLGRLSYGPHLSMIRLVRKSNREIRRALSRKGMRRYLLRRMVDFEFATADVRRQAVVEDEPPPHTTRITLVTDLRELMIVESPRQAYEQVVCPPTAKVIFADGQFIGAWAAGHIGYASRVNAR